MRLRMVLIEISQIRRLPVEQVFPCSEKIVDRYTDSTDTEPLRVVFDGNAYWLFDGYHRLEALTREGKNAAWVTVYRGDKRDAYRRYIADKLKAKDYSGRPVFLHCLERLKADPEWSSLDPKVLSKLFGRKPIFFENLRLWQPGVRGGLVGLTKTRHKTFALLLVR